MNKTNSNQNGTAGKAYTPGLQVSQQTVIRRKRLLPIKGDVLVSKGDHVEAQGIVAETFMPGDVIPINVANLLSLPPRDLPECMLVSEGDKVTTEDIIARTKGIFGFFKSSCKSTADGTVETISEITGQVILRGEPHPVQVLAFIPGTVVEVIPDQGIVIESEVSFIQGIFGIGGETFGKIHIACDSHKQALEEDMITPEMEGKIIVGGARITAEAINKAVKVKAAGIISGGIDDHDLKEFLGYDLGVAITGSEKKGLTLIITEGFGDIAMADKTFNLLKLRNGCDASITGATQIRAGVIRPAVIIPVDDSMPEAKVDSSHQTGVLEIGFPVRIIRDPYFGQIGEINELPAEPEPLDSGTRSRVLRVKLESGDIVTVPRANVELIEE